MRRTRSYAKFLAFALAVSLAFQSAPALAEEYVPINGTVPADNGTSDTPAIAIGKGSEAQGTSSIAIGSSYPAPLPMQTTANAQFATAVGTGAQAEGESSIALGAAANAAGEKSVALGFDTDANSRSVAVGSYAKANGESSIALGETAGATGGYSVAVGRQAKAYGQYSIAIGDYAQVGNNTSGANESVAIGKNAAVREGVSGSIALGSGSNATENYVVSIGSSLTQRRLVNMAAGRADTDAVNVGQLNDTLGIFGTDADGNPIAEVNSTNGAITNKGFKYRDDAPATTTTVQDVFTAIDDDIDDLDANAVKYTTGHKNELTLTDNSGDRVQIGNVAAGDVNATSTHAVNGAQLYSLARSIARELGVDYTGGITIGDFRVEINGTEYTNVAAAIEKLAEGWDINGADGTGGTGTPGTGNGSSTVKPGGSLNVEAGSNIEVIVGDGATDGDADLSISVSDNPKFDSVTADTITANDKVTVGTDGKQTVIDGDTVTVGTGDNKTVIDGTAGTVTVGTGENQTVIDGTAGTVTVGTGDNQTVIDKGTGTFTNANGTTSIDGQKGTFASTKGDQTVIDGGTVTVDNQITVGGTNGTVINNGSVSINNNSAYFRENAMKVGSMTYDGVSNTLNMGGAGRLTGLADGGVYMGSTDAVTGNQLWQAYKRMDQLQESINIVGAHAAALSGLHPIDYNPYEPTTLSAAIGTYRDEYAVAVGVFHYVRENVLFNLGASICSDGDVMGRAGISFTVGRGGDKKKALAPKDMNEVQAQLAEVRQALHELKAENAALKVRLDAKSK